MRYEVEQAGLGHEHGPDVGSHVDDDGERVPVDTATP